MTLTASDVASLTWKLEIWEDCEYFFAALVTLACVGEFVAEFTNWFTHGAREKKERLAKFSTLLLIFSLALELVCLVRTNQMSAKVIGSIDELADDASVKARKASENSGKAISASTRAVDASSNALGIARGAREEADSFRSEIAKAEQDAHKAVRDLGSILQRARDAEAKILALQRESAPRRLTDDQKTELANLLSATPPFTVVFEPLRNVSKEVDDFTDDLMDVFIRMKLLPSGSTSSTLPIAVAASGALGVVVGVLSTDKHPPAADVLIRTLQKWGFEANGEAAPQVVKTATEMHIIVGAKQ